jgi:hypothetical protein
MTEGQLANQTNLAIKGMVAISAIADIAGTLAPPQSL